MSLKPEAQSWRYISSGDGDAAINMALDEAIALSVIEGSAPTTLRIYRWSREAVSLGVFQNSSDIDLEYCRANGIPIVRRPTGGRAILHGEEITYSFSARNEGIFKGGLMDSFRLIGGAFLKAFQLLGIPVEIKVRPNRGKNLIRSPLCFNSVSLGEISFKDKKLIGSAQKRWRNGFLQQGSIPLRIDYKRAARVFRQREAEIDGSFAELILINNTLRINDIESAIVRGFEEVFSTPLKAGCPSSLEQERAVGLLQQKYLSHHWTERVLSGVCKKTGTLRQS